MGKVVDLHTEKKVRSAQGLARGLTPLPEDMLIPEGLQCYNERSVEDHYIEVMRQNRRFIPESEEWYKWDDTAGWNRLKNTERDICAFAQRVYGKKVEQIFTPDINHSSKAGFVNSLKSMVEKYEEIQTPAEQWNSKSKLLRMPSGKVWDLSVVPFATRSPQRDDYLTRALSAEPSTSEELADSRWLQFVGECTKNKSTEYVIGIQYVLGRILYDIGDNPFIVYFSSPQTHPTCLLYTSPSPRD